jgi:hypothetical protein
MAMRYAVSNDDAPRNGHSDADALAEVEVPIGFTSDDPTLASAKGSGEDCGR